MSRKWIATVALVLALTGCEAVSDEQEAAYASREAVSSHLVNATDLPITYNASDPHVPLILEPHKDVTVAGGAWLTPKGWRCWWTDNLPGRHTTGGTPVGSDDYDTWTTFGGYDETVLRCTGPAS